MNDKWFTVGKVVNTHGIRGELKILSQTDFGEDRFAVGSKLLMLNEESGASLEVKIVSSRANKSIYILKLEGFTNINEVEQYKGWVLKVSADKLLELDEGEYYYHEIIGCRVVTEEGEELGVISEILSPGANDVWVVDRPKGSGKQLLLPVIDEVVRTVNTKEKLVTVHLMEGLI
ncbi:ribosome maturation factor RimM [Paenibacillus sp. FSL H8-0548]|uniref:ribosome maturation factor RimM n=1 Tax=Paenibacillus sp. FSL H8-0548 TaxID=1920422 RepID=UPI00096F5138|nr:ribosome maturation factor RimM [Paenibacillus sp. FSL H8-0548]OMF37397.1 ribosome maturation factor RimM [Paenibacillus sp. FSL H8-0548]